MPLNTEEAPDLEDGIIYTAATIMKSPTSLSGECPLLTHLCNKWQCHRISAPGRKQENGVSSPCPSFLSLPPGSCSLTDNLTSSASVLGPITLVFKCTRQIIISLTPFVLPTTCVLPGHRGHIPDSKADSPRIRNNAVQGRIPMEKRRECCQAVLVT